MSLLDRIKEREKEKKTAAGDGVVLKDIKAQISKKFFEEFHGAPISGDKAVRDVLTRLMKQFCPPTIPPSVKIKLFDGLADDILGLGPLEALFRDKDASHIVVKDAEHIFVKREEEWDLTEYHFKDESHLQQMAERIFSTFEQALISGDFASRMSSGQLRFLPLTLPFSFDAWSTSGKIGKATAAFLQSEAVAPPPEEFEQFMSLINTTTFNVGLFLLFRA